MQAFQRDIKRFEELNAQVLGVSSDSLETHREFAKKLELDFPLLVDDGQIREMYGGGRVTFIVDQSGIIRYIHKGMPENDKLLEAISQLQSF